MAQMVVADVDKTGVEGPMEIPDHGVVVPVAVADSGRTKGEWEALIKKHKLPLKITDTKRED